MASDLGIMNRALQKLGTDSITSRADDTKPARELDACYEAVRDAEFRRNLWRFTLARANLSASATVPLGTAYTAQYPMPADCLQVLQVGIYLTSNLSAYKAAYEEAPFSIEGRNILTNLPAPLFIRYVSRVTDANVFDSTFQECFASRLAYECCESITGSSQKKQDLIADYKASLQEANAANAIESPPDVILDDTWIMARLARGTFA